MFRVECLEIQDMKYLIVGLGNIGDEYANTRHNIGFMMVDAFAESKGATWEDKRYGYVARCRVKSAEIILLKPSTYMNLSGNAVRYWLQQEKIPVENMLVLVDDLNLPFGSIRMRKQGSNGGHNGLGHIQQVLFARLPAKELHPLFIHPTARLKDSSARVPIMGLLQFCFS